MLVSRITGRAIFLRVPALMVIVSLSSFLLSVPTLMVIVCVVEREGEGGVGAP